MTVSNKVFIFFLWVVMIFAYLADDIVGVTFFGFTIIMWLIIYNKNL